MKHAHRGTALAACALLLFTGLVFPYGLVPQTFALLSDSESGLSQFTADVPVAAGCALWANATTATPLSFAGLSQTLEGCAHSNGGLRLAGGDHHITGTLRHAGPFETNGNGHLVEGGDVLVQVQPYPYPFRASDYAPGGRAAQQAEGDGRYFVHAGGVVLTQDILKDGLHYVEGSAHISGSGYAANVTIVATGKLIMTARDVQVRAYIDGLLLLTQSSAAGALHLSPADAQLAGAMVAMMGTANVGGNGNRVFGVIVAAEISLSGQSNTFVARTPRAVADSPAGPPFAIQTTSSEPSVGFPELPDIESHEALPLLADAPVGLSFGDFDNDGRKDIAVSVLFEQHFILLVLGTEEPTILLA